MQSVNDKDYLGQNSIGLFGGPGFVTVRHKRGFTIVPITFTAICADCGGSVGGMGEWCMLKKSVWESTWPGTSQKSSRTKMPMKHFLCIGCIEKRISRRLTHRDFDMRSMHNWWPRPRRQFPMSRRLRNRLEQIPFEFSHNPRA
jgi:hypothetical protein